MRLLQFNQVNSSAALQECPHTDDCFPYPSAGLSLATSIATAVPVVVHENWVPCSIKAPFFTMGRLKTKNRVWSLSVVVDGKSQCVDDLRRAVEASCESWDLLFLLEMEVATSISWNLEPTRPPWTRHDVGTDTCAWPLDMRAGTWTGKLLMEGVL